MRLKIHYVVFFYVDFSAEKESKEKYVAIQIRQMDGGLGTLRPLMK